MSTTIQVSKKTLQMLNELKRKLSARNYDEVLRKILMKELNLPDSMFGSNPNLSPFSERDEAEFHEL